MGLESGTYVNDLNQSNPPGGDRKAQGDDHLRLIKTTLKNTFPGAIRPWAFPTILTKTGTYQILDTDQNALIEVDATGGAFTLSLPTLASSLKGWQVWVKKINATANAVTVDSDGGEEIDEESEIVMRRAQQAILFIWNGTEWRTNRNIEIAEAVAKTSTGTLDESELDLVVATTAGGNVTLTLPPVADVRGRVARLKKLTAANQLIIEGNAAETIDGETSWTLFAENDCIEMFSTGAAWLIISRSDFADAKNTNVWLEQQTFNKTPLYGVESIGSASTVTLDFAEEPNKIVTVSQTMTVEADNIVDGSNGWIEFVNGGGFVVTFDSDYVVVDGGQVDVGAGISTRYRWISADGKIYLMKEYIEGKTSHGFYKEYDAGTYAAGPITRTVAHGLGVMPAFVQCFLQLTTAEFGYLTTDYVLIDSIADDDTASRKPTVVMNTTNVRVRYESTGGQIQSLNSAAQIQLSTLATPPNIKVRVFE